MRLFKSGLLSSFILLCALSCADVALAQWTMQPSRTSVRFRGVSAVNSRVAWASGNRGTVTRTIDGGVTWSTSVVPGADELDFRDVNAFDAETAYVLSIGPGDKSRIYKTTDGGREWRLQFTNTNPQAFFDAMAFWDKDNGIAVSDPVDGRFVIITTHDGGATWTQMPAEGMPPALEGEGAFAASGTCITVEGRSNVWFGTGGAAQARVFRSSNGGRTWTVYPTPLISGRPPAGVFSIAFRDSRRGVIVGGDYQQETNTSDNAAITKDGGQTWELLTYSRPSGYRSCVLYVPGTNVPTLIAVGPKGTDYSLDDGRSWMSLSRMGFHSASFAGATGAGWAVGEKGLIAKFDSTIPGTRRRPGFR